jgi:tRNA/rRNA methyltransferase
LAKKRLRVAGTDHRRALLVGGPAIVLVEPQLGENIGTAARAMMNCGLDDLRLVCPREGWPSDKAKSAASGADAILAKARLFPDVPAAVADLAHLYATTARERHFVRRQVTPRQAALEMRAHLASGEPCGVLFGPERTGLVNDHIALADTVLTVPLNPAFASLNLAQAVLVVGYEWFTAASAPPPARLRTGQSRRAGKKALIAFFEHLEEELDRNGFLRNIEKRPSMVRNLRNLFHRAECTEQELRTLHGVVTAFAGPRRRNNTNPQEERDDLSAAPGCNRA